MASNAIISSEEWPISWDICFMVSLSCCSKSRIIRYWTRLDVGSILLFVKKLALSLIEYVTDP